MLWMLSALLLAAWLAGMVVGAGVWIHAFLIAASLGVAMALMRPDRYDTI